MDQNNAAIRQELMAANPTFRQLSQQHADLDSQLHQLQERRFLSPQEEAEELRLKKLKLQLKDEMESLVRERLHVPSLAS